MSVLLSIDKFVASFTPSDDEHDWSNPETNEHVKIKRVIPSFFPGTMQLFFLKTNERL